MPGTWGTSQSVLTSAIECLECRGIAIKACSSLIVSKAYGLQNQADFINGVLIVETHKPPLSLLRLCQTIERHAGRRRGVIWGPRVLDIDILAYHDLVIGHSVAGKPYPHSRPFVLPHPGMADRAFVLRPLAEIAPRWHHPISGLTPVQMLHQLHTGLGGAVVQVGI
jgi:2-amino-4-hydroxy-6-hydroxymethyldihydropteridine diphosphokinase